MTVAEGESTTTFPTAPVLFTHPAAREPATGAMEINPTRDLPPLSWKLVGFVAAGLAGISSVSMMPYLYYPYLLGLAVIVSILLEGKGKKKPAVTTTEEA